LIYIYWNRKEKTQARRAH